ncbi:hypothetical protein F8O01_17645 [Pseudoclavibacter chungangensis]|uniref:Uncharacterized protein n=1 Tax=Pseudoclavibacter chungangensis TaxID=587635 RepID=A0A7J5BMA4_9MICO|nr:hypothetical protein [Pseudoclavibacter chungangensis]KAB1651728.1 hypothetical protein F8O01_17645 [Pseudoclavibacter chungangensis]NYJ66193.1 hypothetical protein [Pseudoclavibacter chungangensis]
MAAEDESSQLESFEPARVHLRSAVEARRRLSDGWNGFLDSGPFDVKVRTAPDGSGELWAVADSRADIMRELQTQVRIFLTSVKAAMDAAIVAAAETVCASLVPIDPALHRMPLCETRQEFDALVPQGHLLGLRPDQVRVLHELQPYQGGDGNRDYIGRVMAHLAEALAVVETDGQLVSAWATNSSPELQVPDGASIDSVSVEPSGLLSEGKLLARFRVTPSGAVADTRIRPNVALDAVLNAPPWPIDLDDTLNKRTSGLLAIARRLLEGLERSVSTPTFIQQFGRLDDIAPARSTSVWLPVQFDDPGQESEVREGLAQSDLNLASYRGDDGTYTLLRLDGDVVFGREIPEASPPEPSVEVGIGVEWASLEAAAALGLPDFVFRPKVVQKGSGLREIGDGTLITGGRGIALQVKAREGATDNAQREASWLTKKAAEGLRQAHGTIRSTLNDPDLTLTNLRDRTVRLPGDSIDWVPVVILDHPDPPHDIIPDREPDKHGLILLRRDWEFLWRQLRSVSAIVDYAYRVANDDRVPLGTEASRYFDLADRDARAEPERIEPWMVGIGDFWQISEPRLPREPVDTSDEVGHDVFHRILEDVAATDFTGDEQIRVEVLALIDQVAATHRAELGRTLLRRIDHCALAPADTLRAQHRVVFLDHGRGP